MEYSEKQLVGWDRDEDAAKQSLLSILRMIQIRSPTVRSIDGLESFSVTLDSDVVEEMAKFETLKTVKFVDCESLVRHLTTFLANSRSRTVLEELYITPSVLSTRNYGLDADEEMIRQALIDIQGLPGRPGLRLKTFHCAPADCCYPMNLLPALDASRLEILSMIGHDFEASAVAELLGRCTRLRELTIDVDSLLGTSETSMTTILSAVKSLPSPNLRKLELYTKSFVYCNEDSIAALRELAQRCPKVEALNIRGNNANEILNIIGECFSNLKELKVDAYDVNQEALIRMIRMGQLKKLRLHFQYGISASVLTMAMNKNLTSLHVDFGSASEFCIWENALSKLDLEQIKVAELSVKFRYAEEGAIAICRRLGPMMISVNFDESMINNEQFVAAIGNKVMSRVRRISLKHASITDLSLRAIGDSCSLLKELNIYGCEWITANGIRSMIENCKKLTRLKVHRWLPGLRDLIRDSTVTIETL